MEDEDGRRDLELEESRRGEVPPKRVPRVRRGFSVWGYLEIFYRVLGHGGEGEGKG